MTERDGSRDYSGDPAARRREWFRYYSEKRIGHQWLQVHLLQGLPVERVLEVGPNLGLVSALLDNAGFRVTTFDLLPSQYRHPRIEHVQAELVAAPVEAFAGHDAILCCETLEHLPWEAVGPVLEKLRAAGPRYLVISVPYQGFQLDWRIYLNAHTVRSSFAFKKLRFLRRFVPDLENDPFGHKWEVGFHGYPLRALEAKLAAAGWRRLRREFTTPTRSVFYLLEAG